jgi:multidrug efflux pump subunit AcrA (membrane-fusion protein)
MTKSLLLRILARTGKRWHKQTALAEVIVMSCIALPVPSSVSFAQAQFVVVPATIRAFFSTDLYAKDSGYVSQVNTDIGDHVKQGQVLAVIAQFDKAEATVQQTKAALEVAKRQLVGSVGL